MTKEQNIFDIKDGEKKHLTKDGIQNFASRVGLNNDNSLSASFYAFNLLTRNRVALEAAYRGSWIAGKVVDDYAEDMTKAGIDVTTNEAKDDINDLQADISKKQIWTSIASLIKWGRLYGGAIAVLQIEGQDLSTPLNIETVSKGQFKGLAVYDRWMLNPDLVNVIPFGPDMGLPAIYQIVNSLTSTQSDSATSTGFINVHHSRVIRNIGIELPYFQAITEMMWGESILERMWDRLLTYDSTTMSVANLVERANNRTVQIEGLRDIIAAGGKAQEGLVAMFDMMRTFQTNEGLTLLDKNDLFASTAYSFAGLDDVLLQFGQQLAGACGIPLVRLFGQSPAGLSATGESDMRSYYDNINAQQKAKLSIGVELLLHVMWQSTFGKPAPKDLKFTFVPLWQMSAKEKAEIAKSNTETIIGANDAGLVSRPAAMMELRDMSGDTGLFSNITDEEIKEAEEEPPPEPVLEEEPAAEPKEAKDEQKRDPDGKFGSGGGASKGESSSKTDQAEKKMKAAKKAALQAKSRADTAPDRHEKNPESMRIANEKIAEYNNAAEEYNATLKTKDSVMIKLKRRFLR